MHRIAVLFLVGALGILGCASQKKAVQLPKVNIAVLDFEARSGIQPEDAKALRNTVISSLLETGRFNIVDRKQLATFAEKRGLKLSQESDLAEAGKLLAVRKILFGTLGKLGSSVCVFNIKMTDVESSSIDVAISKNVEGSPKDIKSESLGPIIEKILNSIDRTQD